MSLSLTKGTTVPEKYIIWERYQGGSPEAEDAAFERLTKTIMHIQARLKAKSGASQIARTFHAKPLLAVTNAHFEIAEDLAEGLRVDCFQPGVCYDTTVRFSNASGMNQPNSERDLRGAAMRLTVSDNEVHDLLMTNFPVSHARDAKQFVAFAQAMSSNRLLGIAKLFLAVGPGEAVRMLRNIIAGSKRTVTSLALDSFWSRGAILWGDAGPVRYFLRPVPGTVKTGFGPETSDLNYLHKELGNRLAKDDVAYEFCLQRFVDERQTPIENAAVE
jgi:hypothetical protein